MQMPQFRWLFAGNIAFFFVVQCQMVTRTFLAWNLTHQESTLALISMMVAGNAVIGIVLDVFDLYWLWFVTNGAGDACAKPVRGVFRRGLVGG